MVFLVDMLAVVLHHGCQQFAVGFLIPLLAIVVEGDILFFLLVRGPLYSNAAMHFLGTHRQLVTLATPCLVPIVERTNTLETLLVELCQLVEIELTLQIAGAVLPLANLVLKLSLLLDKSDGIDTFVHSDGVFPVV